jgi:hypothetical protein
VELVEAREETGILENGTFVVVGALILEGSVLHVVVELLQFLHEGAAIEMTNGAHSVVSVEELVPHVGGLGSNLPCFNTGVRAEGAAPLGNLVVAPTAESPTIRPPGEHGGVDPAAVGIGPEHRHRDSIA